MRRFASRHAPFLAGLATLVAAAGLWMSGTPLSGVAQQVAHHARTAYDAAGLRVERAGWDTLRARSQFAKRTSLGPARTATPARATVRVFRANYDTLYAGPADRPIPIPDRRLGDREPLLVEACGTFRRAGAARTLCQQATVRASPKRVRAEQANVTFPDEGDFRKGRYELRLRTERRAFETAREKTRAAGDTARWEPLSGATPESILLARAESPSGQAAVRVPVDSSGRGTFDLARYEGYDDFRYHLRAAMEQPRRLTVREGAPPPSATVAFEVRAGPGVAPLRPVERFQKTVRRLTPAERRRRVQGFAQSAARAIARRLHEDRDDEEEWADEWAETVTRATVTGWRYDRAAERYTMDLRVRWHETDDRDERDRIDGTLTVEEGNRRARFTGERGNRRTVERWREAAEGDEIELGPLAEPDTSASLPVVERRGRLPGVAERRGGPHGSSRDDGRGPDSDDP